MEPHVLHVDNHLLVVAKPACVPSVPDDSGDESLLDAARAWVKREYAKPGDVFLGVVQRLDRPVSGILVFARTSKAARRLTDAFRGGGAEKRYFAVGAGAPPAGSGVLEQWLWKDRERNLVQVVAGPREGAKLARTRWRRVGSAGGSTLFEFEPETGRTHQLRVHALHMGCPIIGDPKYFDDDPNWDFPGGMQNRLHLHARRLRIPHPDRGVINVTAPLPPHMVQSWNLLGLDEAEGAQG